MPVTWGLSIEGNAANNYIVADHAAADALYTMDQWGYGTSWDREVYGHGGNDYIVRDRVGDYKASAVWQGPGGPETYNGDVKIWGGMGADDTIDYSGWTGGVEVVLDAYGFDTGYARNLGAPGQIVYGEDWLNSIENVVGTDQDDEIWGNAFANELSGEGGDDLIHGMGGNDDIDGGIGDDDLWGESGSDTIRGGQDDDMIDGGADADSLHGDSGSDTVYGQDGNDWIFGGTGNDSLWAGDDNDAVYGGSNNDQLFGGAGLDVLYGGTGADSLYGGDATDHLYAGDQDDTLRGQGGDDELNGQDGADVLFGGQGKDEISGGDDADDLYGGADEDTFVFKSGETGVDVIQDFVAGEDRIDIDDLLGVNGATKGYYAAHVIAFNTVSPDGVASAALFADDGNGYDAFAILEGYTKVEAESLISNGQLFGFGQEGGPARPSDDLVFELDQGLEVREDYDLILL